MTLPQASLIPRRFGSFVSSRVALAEAAPTRAAGAGAPAAAAKPRATGGITKGRRKPWHYWAGMFLLSGLGGGSYYVYTNFGGPVEALAAARAWFQAMRETPMADPTIEELKRALGPPPPDGYINVILGFEHVLVRREWDARHGWKVEIRPGVKQLLNDLSQLGCFITFWGDGPSATVMELLNKMSMELKLQGVTVTQLHLGTEHTFGRPGTISRERHIEFFNRDPRTILLIDSDPISMAVNPSNTVLVDPIEGRPVEEGKEEAPRRAGPDNTCGSIVAVVQRIRESTSQMGRVDVPAVLRSLKNEAGASGFTSDSQGLYEYLQHEAEAEAAATRARKETGLGGLVRRSNASSSFLKNKATVTEAAVNKSYIDPGRDVGEDSLVTKRVRAAVASMEAKMRGM